MCGRLYEYTSVGENGEHVAVLINFRFSHVTQFANKKSQLNENEMEYSPKLIKCYEKSIWKSLFANNTLVFILDMHPHIRTSHIYIYMSVIMC